MPTLQRDGPGSEASGIWRQRNALAFALWPLSQVYALLVALRRLLYRLKLLRTYRAARPVIVVGNVVAGGAGKTPVVIALVQALVQKGWKPGVISRGYGRSSHDCREVLPDSTPQEVGDEPALIAKRCRVPVFVARRRIDAAQALLNNHPHVDVLVCDDGLQHLALARDMEICVFNQHNIGNGFLLPAGPLREHWPRQVDAVVYSGASPGGSAPGFALQRQLAPWLVNSDGQRIAWDALRNQPVHAVAGIARPEDFFAMLRNLGLQLIHTEALPDHYDFDSWSCLPNKGLRLICTEKDALKLWSRHPQALAAPLEVQLPDALIALVERRLHARTAPLSSPRA